MSKLKVIQPGMLSLIQDVGRFGVAQLGLSQGGP
ncbi:MAG: allophanate hydrolase subunit 2, partial [Psychromonas sp.]